RAAAPRGPVVAGVELQAGMLRVVVGQREGARLRVSGRGDSALPEGAVAGGLVSDRFVVADALRTAFASAEHLARAERVAIAIDSDDMRTHHAVTTFEREDLRAALGAGEESRAVREAATDAHARATAATEEDAALRTRRTHRAARRRREGLGGLRGRIASGPRWPAAGTLALRRRLRGAPRTAERARCDDRRDPRRHSRRCAARGERRESHRG